MIKLTKISKGVEKVCYSKLMWRKIFVDKKRAKFPAAIDEKRQIFGEKAKSYQTLSIRWFYSTVENRRDFRNISLTGFKDLFLSDWTV